MREVEIVSDSRFGIVVGGSEEPQESSGAANADSVSNGGSNKTMIASDLRRAVWEEAGVKELPPYSMFAAPQGWITIPFILLGAWVTIAVFPDSPFAERLLLFLGTTLVGLVMSSLVANVRLDTTVFRVLGTYLHGDYPLSAEGAVIVTTKPSRAHMLAASREVGENDMVKHDPKSVDQAFTAFNNKNLSFGFMVIGVAFLALACLKAVSHVASGNMAIELWQNGVLALVWFLLLLRQGLTFRSGRRLREVSSW